MTSVKVGPKPGSAMTLVHHLSFEPWIANMAMWFGFTVMIAVSS
ncbi:hypothetical protein ACVZCY_01695 [Klebsiella grimontii]|nr:MULTISPECIES: hypothetical protein [Klebsiella]MDU2772049.1 hypothetical protein [Klebsiella grimontii]WDQ10511.1 hypothetical protein PVK07_20130 [Klebsiella grimontii]